MGTNKLRIDGEVPVYDYAMVIHFMITGIFSCWFMIDKYTYAAW